MAKKRDGRTERTVSGPEPPVRTTPPGGSLLTEVAWVEIARSLNLSPRELQLKRGVFDNLTEGAIAANLRISEHRVHTHLHRLFAKLWVTTRTQMVLQVMEELLRLTLSEASPLPPICCHRANGRCPVQG